MGRGIDYVKGHTAEMVADIIVLAGFHMSKQDIIKFLAGYSITIDMTSARGIICTQNALLYVIDCAKNGAGVTDIHVDMINKIITGSYDMSFCSGLRCNTSKNGSTINKIPSMDSTQFSSMMQRHITSSALYDKVSLVSDMIMESPYSHANIRTSLLALDLILLKQYDRYLSLKNVNYRIFANYVYQIQSRVRVESEFVEMLMANIA